MTTQPVHQQTQQGTFSQVNSILGRYSFNLPSIAQKLNKIAVPAIALFVFSNLTGALAGPIGYGICINACELACTQAGLILAPTTVGWSMLAILGGPLGCPILCGPVLAAPSP